MEVLLTLTTASTDTGPFDLYSDVDNYVTPFETGVSRVDLIAGYTSTIVPASTSIVRITSTGVCTDSVDILLDPPTTTTTTTETPTTTTTTTVFIPPTVATYVVGAVAKTTAIGNGEVLTEGTNPVTLRGICWDINPNPEFIDAHQNDVSGGIGTFSVNITGLLLNTLYYARAYAFDDVNLVYGEQVTFTTLDHVCTPLTGTAEDITPTTTTTTTIEPTTTTTTTVFIPPTVQTYAVKNISTTTATGDGEVLTPGTNGALLRGVCWDTSPNPTFSDSQENAGGGLGRYDIPMSDLIPDTDYWVKAYVYDGVSLVYGNEVVFTTDVLPTTTTTTTEEPTTTTTTTEEPSTTTTTTTEEPSTTTTTTTVAKVPITLIELPVSDIRTFTEISGTTSPIDQSVTSRFTMTALNSASGYVEIPFSGGDLTFLGDVATDTRSVLTAWLYSFDFLDAAPGDTCTVRHEVISVEEDGLPVPPYLDLFFVMPEETTTTTTTTVAPPECTPFAGTAEEQ